MNVKEDIVSRINSRLNMYWESGNGKKGVILDVPMEVGELIYNDIFTNGRIDNGV